MVVNTGPKRNKSRWRMTDRPPPGCSSRAKGNPKDKGKNNQHSTQQSGGGNTFSTEEKATPGRSARLMRPADAAQTLSTHWPGLYAGGQSRPLAIGVREQLFADAERRALPLSKKVIRRCLKTLTRTETYLSGLTAGVACYNADGSVESLIPPERERAATAKLARVQADKPKKQAAKAPATDEKKEH
uniref:ProQ/FINO family protein n=1 Tax=Enterobacter cloacae complex sp. TaxID=2027919 RepID=UPI0021011632|nr:ProQ/FINO family protein [Enterobacter cloacae complex sp.]